MSPTRHLAAALAVGALLTTGATTATAATAAAAPGASDVPYTDAMRGSGTVAVGDRAGSGITVKQARSVKVVTMRFDVVRHAGVPSARVRTTLKRVLPAAPQRYRQVVAVGFDEERVLVTNVATGRTRFLDTSGGGPLRGCHRQASRVDGRVLTQWVPLSCLLTDTSEMSTRSMLTSTRTHREVGVHGRTLGFGPFLRWRD
ncbi:hypothetical protein [Nocardioides sp.]|uniref:hypothetical protein n=1 Tax=Nocardioides sp. TaxID=35761 RepID=UPI0027280F1A|nr:hypothetical protein [Nocardioides sp.]MDO9458093.1 hypothetical protein [Nocardioides sp.]